MWTKRVRERPVTPCSSVCTCCGVARYMVLTLTLRDVNPACPTTATTESAYIAVLTIPSYTLSRSFASLATPRWGRRKGRSREVAEPRGCIHHWSKVRRHLRHLSPGLPTPPLPPLSRDTYTTTRSSGSAPGHEIGRGGAAYSHTQQPLCVANLALIVGYD